MSEQEPTLRSVEELESWFRALPQDDPSANVEFVRLAVRCALEEETLRGRLHEGMPESLPARVREQVRAELRISAAPQAVERQVRRRPAVRWLAGVSAIAAMVCLWIGLSPDTTPVADLAMAEALAVGTVDDLDVALEELDEEIALLERGWGAKSALGLPNTRFDRWLDATERVNDAL